METTHSPGAAHGKSAEPSFLVLNIPRLEAGASRATRPVMERQSGSPWPDSSSRGFKAQWVLIIAIVGFLAGWVAANLLPG